MLISSQRNTGPQAIFNALASMDADSIEARAKDLLATGKKTKRGEGVALLNIVKGLRRSLLSPKDYMIKHIPVIPPKYRPFAALGDSLIPGDANILYKDLIDIKEAYDQEKDMFGEHNAGQSRLDLYDAIRSSYGYGDPVKTKTKQKEVKGFLKKIVGKTSKLSYFQSKMLAKTMDNVGRSTVIVNPELGIDDIELPYDIAFTMYAPYVQKWMRQMGMTDSDALKALRDRTPYARHALEEVVKTRPVIYSRAPAWHGFSINAGNVHLIEGDAIGTNPYVTTGMGMDFDGDTINVHVPSTDAAVKEAYEKFMPSKMAFSNRLEGKIVPLPKLEQILGLYESATAPAQNTYRFNSKEEALLAIKSGKIDLSDDIEFPDDPIKTASAEVQEDKTHPLNARDPKTGKFIQTSKNVMDGIEILSNYDNIKA